MIVPIVIAMTLDEVLLGVKNQSNIDISCSHFIIIVLVYYVFLGYSIHSMNFMVFLSCLANFPRITLQQQIIQTLSGYFINKLHQSSVHLIIVCLILIPPSIFHSSNSIKQLNKQTECLQFSLIQLLLNLRNDWLAESEDWLSSGIN